MTYPRCDMDSIINELPVHSFRLHAAVKNDITQDIHVRILKLLPKRNRTGNQQTAEMALHSNRAPGFCVHLSFSFAYVCKLGQFPKSC